MSSENQAVGLGVYILSTIWLISLLLCVVSVRTGQLIGAIAFIVSSLITLLLILIPRVSTSTKAYGSEKVYDRLFILRYCSLAFMVISFMGGFGYFFIYHCLSPVQTKKMQHWFR